jgi:hypothetical protein
MSDHLTFPNKLLIDDGNKAGPWEYYRGDVVTQLQRELGEAEDKIRILEEQVDALNDAYIRADRATTVERERICKWLRTSGWEYASLDNNPSPDDLADAIEREARDSDRRSNAR